MIGDVRAVRGGTGNSHILIRGLSATHSLLTSLHLHSNFIQKPPSCERPPMAQTFLLQQTRPALVLVHIRHNKAVFIASICGSVLYGKRRILIASCLYKQCVLKNPSSFNSVLPSRPPHHQTDGAADGVGAWGAKV